MANKALAKQEKKDQEAKISAGAAVAMANDMIHNILSAAVASLPEKKQVDVIKVLGGRKSKRPCKKLQ